MIAEAEAGGRRPRPGHPAGPAEAGSQPGTEALRDFGRSQHHPLCDLVFVSPDLRSIFCYFNHSVYDS